MRRPWSAGSGSEEKFQSTADWNRAGNAAGARTGSRRSEPPASTTRTREPSALSRLASTHPAEPAPTITKSKLSMLRGGGYPWQAHALGSRPCPGRALEPPVEGGPIGIVEWGEL